MALPPPRDLFKHRRSQQIRKDSVEECGRESLAQAESNNLLVHMCASEEDSQESLKQSDALIHSLLNGACPYRVTAWPRPHLQQALCNQRRIERLLIVRQQHQGIDSAVNEGAASQDAPRIAFESFEFAVPKLNF